MNAVQPTIWRRLIVPWTWRLDQLHLIIKAAFGWHDAHLHEFRIGGLHCGDPDLLDDSGYDDMPRVFDEHEVWPLDFGREPGTSFLYAFDFGDYWQDVVELEHILPLSEPAKRASCSGGAPGLQRMSAVQAATQSS